jgi:hypothetical protein
MFEDFAAYSVNYAAHNGIVSCWLQDQNLEQRNSGLVLSKLQLFNMHCSIYIGLITRESISNLNSNSSPTLIPI